MASLKYVEIPYAWKPLVLNDGWPNHDLSAKIQRRIAKVCTIWENTPYISGQQMVGEGTDCVRFFAAFVDFMYGFQRVAPERLPQDYSMHTRAGAIGVMRDILRLYPEMRPVRSNILQPGDVLVVGPKGGGPSHCMIVGAAHNTLWHAINEVGVCRTGWALIEDHQTIFRAYRFNNRKAWGKGWIEC